MSDHAQQPSSGSVDPGKERHPLDGIRLRLPVPRGHHSAEVVASLAKWLCHQHDLEPFDMQVTDSPEGPAGTLWMRVPPAGRMLELCVKRARAAVQRADSITVSAQMLQTMAKSTRSHAHLLVSEGRQRQERSRQLRTTTALARLETRERLNAGVSRTLTERP